MRDTKGITLIALIITIIVLLILAGISIATLTGENGILTKANTAKEKTEIEEAKEQAKLDIEAYIADRVEKGQSTKLNDSIIQEILTEKSYVKKEEGQPGETSFKTVESGYVIPYSELYTKKNEISFIFMEEEASCLESDTWRSFMNRIVKKQEDDYYYEIYNQELYDTLPKFLQNFVRMSIKGNDSQILTSSLMEPGELETDGSIVFLSIWYDHIIVQDSKKEQVHWDDKIRERRNL